MRRSTARTGRNGWAGSDALSFYPLPEYRARENCAMSDFIEFYEITKTFTGVTALDQVSLSIHRGECHALMGENGAGKSTLGKILAGIYQPDSGEIRIDGRPRAFRSPREARVAGVGMVHQELAFCPDLSVAENL